jgi:para-aminobenzoate synthetase component 1
MVDKVIAYDHEKNEIYFLGLGETEIAAKRKISEIKADIQKPPLLKRKGQVGEIHSSISRERYLEKIEEIQERIRAGETYQVNFTQQLRAECSLDPWDLYQRLFALNPAPFSSFFHFGDFFVVLFFW